MSKHLNILILIIFALFMFGCTAGPTRGVIVIYNFSNSDCSGLKIGDVWVGFVPRGTVSTLIFTREQEAAEIVSRNFNTKYSNMSKSETHYEGKINLKLNYSYCFLLRTDYDDNEKRIYLHNAQGIEVGTNESNLIEGENLETRY